MSAYTKALNESKIEDSASLRLRGEGIRFIRIRRTTCYLVGSSDRWNTSKKNELSDRVKHGLELQ